METKLKMFLPALLALTTAAGVQAQFYKLHGASISVGATGNYLETLTDNPRPYTFNTPTRTGFVTNTISNQQQTNSSTLGFLTSLQFHPVPWAGIEINYGYQH